MVKIGEDIKQHFFYIDAPPDSASIARVIYYRNFSRIELVFMFKPLVKAGVSADFRKMGKV